MDQAEDNCPDEDAALTCCQKAVLLAYHLTGDRGYHVPSYLFGVMPMGEDGDFLHVVCRTLEKINYLNWSYLKKARVLTRLGEIRAKKDLAALDAVVSKSTELDFYRYDVYGRQRNRECLASLAQGCLPEFNAWEFQKNQRLNALRQPIYIEL
jgi:hypothetical protein